MSVMHSWVNSGDTLLISRDNELNLEGAVYVKFQGHHTYFHRIIFPRRDAYGQNAMEDAVKRRK